MSTYGRASQDAPSTRPLHQVRTVWVALAAVLITLSLLFLAYGWRSYDFTAKRAQTQSQSRAELTRSQVFNAFRHMDDILLQTKSVFERAGPGIASQTGMLAQSNTPLGLAPYTCIGIVNALGDAFFRIPENCVLPDIAAKASEFQPMGGATGRLFTEAFDGVEGPQIVRAVRLYYADETFAGMVLGVLSTDYVFSVFKGLDPAGYHIHLELDKKPGAVLIAHSGATANAGTIGAAKTVLEFEGFSGPIRVDIRSSISRSAALEEWLESVIWPFLGYLVVFGGMVQGARLLTGALRQQMASDLVAQRARVESEVQARFIANISHEVRTPMNGVLGAASLMGKTSLDEGQRQLLGLVERSGRVLLSTINDLLDIGKLREGQMELEQQPVDLIHLLEDSCALQAPQAHAKGLDLIACLDLPDQLGVLGDALRIQQVVTNLLNNAVKFTSEGMVSLEASLKPSPGGRQLSIQVSDTGIGIDLSQAEWLFQPFQQADSSTARRFGGTGLGLAITDQLVRLMGGVLEVRSQPGAGTTFTATWPLAFSESKPNPQALLPNGLVCSILLSETESGQRERKAMTRQLTHLGVVVLRQVKPREGRTTQSRPILPDAMLTDENCLDLVQSDSEAFLLVLCREPAMFRLPAHLQGKRHILISKPARRAELLHGFLRVRTPASGASPEGSFAAMTPTAIRLEAEFDSPAKSAPARYGPLSGLNLLVAEDHAVNQILIRQMLELAGAQVQLVPNGLEAIKTLFEGETGSDSPFDLVLMDCQMPELDGFTATTRIRRREKLRPGQRRIPIIAMTALAMPEDTQRCLDSGMDDYCSKPLDEVVLMRKIVEWTRTGGPLKKDAGFSTDSPVEERAG